MEALFVPLSLLAGGLLAVQAGATTKLSKETGSPFVATTIQVVIAGALLLVVAAATGTVVAFGGLPRIGWGHAIGGIATAIYVASTIPLFPRPRAACAGLPRIAWWHAIGGIATAIYVASTILLFPRLGAVVTVGLFIAGQ